MSQSRAANELRGSAPLTASRTPIRMGSRPVRTREHRTECPEPTAAAARSNPQVRSQQRSTLRRATSMLLAPMTTVVRELEALLGKARAITKRDALLAYECDGYTIHRQPPLAVVFPESTEEVQKVLRILHRHRVPFVPRGAGTCLSGGPTPVAPAVVVELARMRKVLEVDVVDRIAVVQPGVVNLDLTTHVKHLALHYAPDPSSQSVCTIGGNVAENSGGPHCFKYGMTVDHVVGATVVLPDGEIA